MSSVDVIVPCYQYGHFLGDCVGSVLSQEGVEVRVLIIDDASQDNSKEVGESLALQDSRVQYVRHAWNCGHIRTFNEGIAWSASRYLMLLSADDFLLPGALGRAAALMDAHPEVGFSFGSALYMYPDGSRKEVVPPVAKALFADVSVLSGRRFIQCARARNMIATPTVVVRTEVQKRLGGYRVELPHSGDMEMWLRFAACSAVGFVKTPQAVYRRHDGNMSTRYAADNLLPDVRQRRAALDCFFESGLLRKEDADVWREMLYGELGKEAVALASGALNTGDYRIADELVKLGLEIDPSVKHSWTWMKFVLKRLVLRRVRGGEVTASPLSATANRQELR